MVLGGKAYESIAWVALDGIHKISFDTITFHVQHTSPGTGNPRSCFADRHLCSNTGQTAFFSADSLSRFPSRLLTLMYMSEPITAAMHKSS
jgi:hypothetical protein